MCRLLCRWCATAAAAAAVCVRERREMSRGTSAWHPNTFCLSHLLLLLALLPVRFGFVSNKTPLFTTLITICSRVMRTAASAILRAMKHETSRSRHDRCPSCAVLSAGEQQMCCPCCCLDHTAARFWPLFWRIPVSSMWTVSPLRHQQQ